MGYPRQQRISPHFSLPSNEDGLIAHYDWFSLGPSARQSGWLSWPLADRENQS